MEALRSQIRNWVGINVIPNESKMQSQNRTLELSLKKGIQGVHVLVFILLLLLRAGVIGRDLFSLDAINTFESLYHLLREFIEIPGIVSSIAIYTSTSLNICLGIVVKPGNKGHYHFG